MGCEFVNFPVNAFHVIPWKILELLGWSEGAWSPLEVMLLNFYVYYKIFACQPAIRLTSTRHMGSVFLTIKWSPSKLESISAP